MKKVKTYIEIKEYEDDSNDVIMNGSKIKIISNLSAVLISFARTNNIPKEAVIISILSTWHDLDKPDRKSTKETFTDGD